MKLLAGALSVCISVFATFAHGEDNFPTRTITVVVPAAPGGPTDIMARFLAEYLKAEWPAPVIVENRAGGGSNVGSAYVSRAAPDGYTLLTNLDAIAANVALYKNSL